MAHGLVQAVHLLSALPKRLQIERWRARIRAKTASNFKLRILLLVLFSGLNVLLGALLYKSASPEESWRSSLFTVYAVLWSIPGSDVTNSESLMGTVVLNVIFVFGLLVFATILAMITDEVNNVLLAARSGRTALVLSGHVLLLNWNSTVPYILEQLELVNAQGKKLHPLAGRPVVLLADMDKDELDAKVLAAMKLHNLEVHVRTGKPFKIEHLERVSARDAGAVLLLHPEVSEGGDGSDGDGSSDDGAENGAAVAASNGSDNPGAAALKLQTMMALSGQLLGSKAKVVVQMPEATAEGGSSRLEVLDQVLAMAGHPSSLVQLPVKRMINVMAVSSTIQPLAATIYSSILQHGLTPNLVFLPIPAALFQAKRQVRSSSASSNAGAGSAPQQQAAGSAASNSLTPRGELDGALVASSVTYEDVRGHFGSAYVLLGYVVASRDQELMLNPADSDTLAPEDVVVALTHAQVYATAPAAEGKAAAKAKIAPPAAIAAALAALKAPAKPAKTTVAEVAAAAAGMGVAADSTHVLTGDKPAPTCNGTPGTLPVGNPVPEPVSDKIGSEAAPAAAAAAAVPFTAAPPGPAQAGNSQGAQAASALGSAAVKPLGAGPSDAGAAPPTGTPALPLAGAPSTPFAEPVAQVSFSGPASAGTGAMNGAHPGVATTKAAAAATATATAVAAAPKSAPAMPPAAAASKKPKKKKSSFFSKLCFCMGPSPVKEDAADSTEGKKQAKGFDKFVKTVTSAASDVTSGVTGVVGGAAGLVAGVATTVGGAALDGVTTVAKTATKGVTTVAGAALDAATTVGNFAVDGVTTVAGAGVKGLTTVAGAAVKGVSSLGDAATTGFNRSVTGIKGIGSGSKASLDGGIKRTAAPAALAAPLTSVLASPVTWLFGSNKAEPTAKDLASARLDNILAEGPSSGMPDKAVKLVVAGFSAAEAEELLQYMLDFAPPGSEVAFTMPEDQELPDGLEMEGQLEEMEECYAGMEPVHHLLKYKFLLVPSPTSCEALARAGLLEADSLLLAAEEDLRGNPWEADACVLGSMVEVQHLLACQGILHSGSLSSKASGGWASLRRNMTSKSMGAASAASEASDGLELLVRRSTARDPNHKLHVVACVQTTSAKAVMKSFFGECGWHKDSTSSSQGPAAGDSEQPAVIGSALFNYELLVPGELEGAVLVQAAHQPLVIKVVNHLLCTSDGCELYLLKPSAFGLRPGETLAFPEVQEVGRMLKKTVLGVVADGQVNLVPPSSWRWAVQETDRIAVIAESW